MQKDYAGVMESQKQEVNDKVTRIFRKVEETTSYLNNLKCKNPEIVMKMAPMMTSELVVYAPDIIELIIDDLIEDEVLVQNELERVTYTNQALIEAQLKKNRVKRMIRSGAQLGAWGIIEQLERFKNEIGSDEVGVI